MRCRLFVLAGISNTQSEPRGRERSLTDGPYAESKDLVTGNLVLEAASLEEAAELARDCPIFEATCWTRGDTGVTRRGDEAVPRGPRH